MTRTLDEILGITKTTAKHDFEIGQRVKTNNRQAVFEVGREGTVDRFDRYNLVGVRLDLLPRSSFYFHHTQLEKIDG